MPIDNGRCCSLNKHHAKSTRFTESSTYTLHPQPACSNASRAFTQCGILTSCCTNVYSKKLDRRQWHVLVTRQRSLFGRRSRQISTSSQNFIYFSAKCCRSLSKRVRQKPSPRTARQACSVDHYCRLTSTAEIKFATGDVSPRCCRRTKLSIYPGVLV